MNRRIVPRLYWVNMFKRVRGVMMMMTTSAGTGAGAAAGHLASLPRPLMIPTPFAQIIFRRGALIAPIPEFTPRRVPSVCPHPLLTAVNHTRALRARVIVPSPAAPAPAPAADTGTSAGAASIPIIIFSFSSSREFGGTFDMTVRETARFERCVPW